MNGNILVLVNYYPTFATPSWESYLLENNTINIDLQPIPTSSYPTPAHRPKYSVLDKTKIKLVFGIAIKGWEESLSNCL